MADIQKPMAKIDGQQVLKEVFNQPDHSITVSGFISSKVGNKIERTPVSSSIDDYSYFDGTNLLYTLRVTYSSSSKDQVNSVERIA
jgi:hypothetical protein